MNAASERRPLADLIEIVSGQVDPKASPYLDMPHVGGENIESGSGYLSGVKTARELGLISGKYLFDANMVLYSKIRPNLNKVALPSFAGICSADIYPLRPIPGLMERRYLAHLLRSQDFLDYAAKYSSRTNIPKLNREALLAYRAPAPPVGEQRRTAALLDQADALRAKRRQAIDRLDSVLQSLFQDMFGDPLLYPRHPMRVLADCAEVVSGVTKGRKFGTQKTVQLRYLRVANVQDGHLDLTEIKTIEALPSDLEALRLQHGDVLLTEGGDFDKLGRGAMWQGQVPDCIHQNHVFRVRTHRAHLLPRYFEAYLQTRFAKAYFLRCAKKTTNLASMNMTQLRGLPVMLPPVKAQEAFGIAVARIEDTCDSMQQSLRSLDLLFASLQSKLLTRATGKEHRSATRIPETPRHAHQLPSSRPLATAR